MSIFGFCLAISALISIAACGSGDPSMKKEYFPEPEDRERAINSSIEGSEGALLDNGKEYFPDD